ncbi:MAG: hypothetical protein ACRYF3_05500 [Janthinobacterium lividum]
MENEHDDHREVLAATASTGERNGVGHHHDDLDYRAGERDQGWVAWLLVIAAVAPVLVFAEATRQVFSGARDQEWFGAYSGDGSQLSADVHVSFSDHFAYWSFYTPAGPTLLASTLGVLVLVGLTLVGCPAWLIPARATRWAACGVAAVLSLGALAILVATLTLASRAGDDGSRSQMFGRQPGFIETGPDVAVLATVCVLAGVGAVLLLRSPAPALPLPVLPADADTADLAPRLAPDSAQPPATPDAEPVPAPTAASEHLGRPPEDVPHVSSADYALYRRPESFRRPDNATNPPSRR